MRHSGIMIFSHERLFGQKIKIGVKLFAFNQNDTFLSDVSFVLDVLFPLFGQCNFAVCRVNGLDLGQYFLSLLLKILNFPDQRSPALCFFTVV